MKKILLYNHGTSYNHGCEAIVRTISGIVCEKYPDSKIAVASTKPEEDKEYFSDELDKYSFVPGDALCGLPFKKRRFLLGSLCTLFGGLPIIRHLYKNTVKLAKTADLAVSVGGDTYSYGKSAALTAADRSVRKSCKKTVLWGCSINAEFLDPIKNKAKIESLKEFSLITARETITYETFLSLGFENVKYYPDPAFTLPTIEPTEKMFDNDKDIVGINISPLAQSFESGDSIMLKNYVCLVKSILEETDFNVALISHVRCKTTDDSDSAAKLCSYFPDNPRIKVFDKGNCMELKGYISKCRFFVAARTHASIAAYSNCVPTIVVGYSVKAKGIAKDLFGTYEGYVLPVQELTEETSLKSAFDRLVENEDEIRKGLETVMPDYIEKARSVGDEIVKLLEQK